jgi:hypothetical protein
MANECGGRKSLDVVARPKPGFASAPYESEQNSAEGKECLLTFDF